MRTIFIIGLLITSAASGAQLRLIETGGITNVYLASSNQTVRLTNFRNRHHIYDAALSPSGKYAYVWHMDFRPRKVLVIDVTTGRIMSDFAPGVAGELQWSADDRIIHLYGFGTGRYASIYDPRGNDIFPDDQLTNLFEKCCFTVDPSCRALVMLPNLRSCPEQVTLVRTSDGAIRRVGPKQISCLEASWKDRTLQIDYTTSTNITEDVVPQKLEIQMPEDWLGHKAQ